MYAIHYKLQARTGIGNDTEATPDTVTINTLGSSTPPPPPPPPLLALSTTILLDGTGDVTILVMLPKRGAETGFFGHRQNSRSLNCLYCYV